MCLTENYRADWPDGLKDKAFLSVNQAAEILGLAASTAYSLVDHEKIPAIRVGKAIRIPASALGEFIAAQLEGRAPRA